MASKSDSSTKSEHSEKDQKDEKQKEAPKIEFDVSKDFPNEIKEEIKKTLMPMIENPSPTKISKNLSSMLNKNFGAGWNVVAGGHYSGCFTYIEGMYTEAKVKELVISIFKIYIPKK